MTVMRFPCERAARGRLADAGRAPELHQLQRFLYTLAYLGLADACNPQPIADIVGDGEIGDERVGLKDDAEIAL